MKLSTLAALCFAAITSSASAGVYVVDSVAHSSTGGAALATLSVNSGNLIRISSSLSDYWNLGALPRYSNANGLVGNLYASGSDESGATAGTLIGQDYGIFSQFGYSAPYGSLVGEIDGVYQLLGANGYFTAWGTGALNLMTWDSNWGDNAGAITFNVDIVPEPSAWAMLIVGFGLVGGAARRRRFRTVLG